MVSKKILGLAIAAAFSSQAFAISADINLADDNTTKVVFAKETIDKTTKTTVSGADYYELDGDSAGYADLDMVTPIGVGMNFAGGIGQKLFMRVDLTAGALFKAAPTATTADATSTVAQGGAGAGYVIFEVTATASKPQNATIVVGVPNLQILQDTTTVGYSFNVYETLTGAVNKTGSLANQAEAAAVSIASGLKSGITAGTGVADVEFGFKRWVAKENSNNKTTNIGMLALTVDTATASAVDGSQLLADFTNMASAGSVKLVGDFSQEADSDWGFSAGNCSAGVGTALTVAGDKKSASITLANATGKANLCYDITLDKAAIPEGSYTAEVTFTPVADRLFPIAYPGSGSKIADITRNGTTIQVPYLTTFEDYNQRLVLVNRGASEVAYTTTFTPETGVTAAAGTKATGTLKPMSTTIIKATDLVTITGSTRTAATVAIVSPTGNIDAATTMVNLADKSTDTVNLD